jgi:hypothetical protein
MPQDPEKVNIVAKNIQNYLQQKYMLTTTGGVKNLKKKNKRK